MPPPPAASDLERRKQVRLRLRTDLVIAPQRYEGRTYYVVKDPVSLRYYRFKDQEHFLIQLMDGQHTLDEAQKAFEKRYRPDRLTLEDLEQFGQQLLTAGLVQNESPQAGKQLFDRKKKRERTQLVQTLTNILYIKIPIFDPEKLLTRMLPYFRFIFTTWFFLLSVLFMLSAVLLVATHFETFRSRLPSYHEFFSFKTIIYMWVALGIVKVIHEFGHGLSCKAFGGEVHEMGFLLLCLSPAMYCNVSDAWTLPNKWHRIIISFAGIYVELMIAALATFIWWYTPGQPFVNYMALAVMVICSVSTVVFNGNPLMRYDGYYVLADWLEIPNLRDRSNRYLQRVVMDKCLGIEVLPEPYMAPWRRILFITYAIVSWIYRWVVTFAILYFLATFLKPYKLQVLSGLLTVMAVGSLVGWPLYRLFKNLHKRGRLPDMKPVRTTISAAVLAVVVLAFLLVPLPVSRIREYGLVQVQPTAQTPVHIQVPGRLEKILVQEGQSVKKGAPLATFSNVELEIEFESARADFNIQDRLVQGYTTQLNTLVDRTERNKVEMNKVKAENEREKARTRMVQVQQQLAVCRTLVAPRDGVVMSLPKLDEIGKRFDRDAGKPFCSIGDPTSLRVLVPLGPDDYDLLRDNMRRFWKRGEQVPVTIRVQGNGAATWSGKVTHLPAAEAKEIPWALSNKGGGPLAIKPSSPQDKLQPQVQVYLVGVDFTNPDPAICPGTLGQVSIHCEYRSAAWWVWRLISKTFDIGLLG